MPSPGSHEEAPIKDARERRADILRMHGAPRPYIRLQRFWASSTAAAPSCAGDPQQCRPLGGRHHPTADRASATPPTAPPTRCALQPSPQPRYRNGCPPIAAPNAPLRLPSAPRAPAVATIPACPCAAPASIPRRQGAHSRTHPSSGGGTSTTSSTLRAARPSNKILLPAP